MLFILITTIVFITDHLLKILVDRTMHVNQSIPVIKDILSLKSVQNRGAAFGLFWGSTTVLIIIGIAAIIAIIYFHEHVRKNAYLQIPLAFLLGGSLGNIVDRLSRWYVIDYIDFHIWPVFNYADIMINLGVFLIILHIMWHRGEEE